MANPRPNRIDLGRLTAFQVSLRGRILTTLRDAGRPLSFSGLSYELGRLNCETTRVLVRALVDAGEIAESPEDHPTRGRPRLLSLPSAASRKEAPCIPAKP